MTDFESFLVRIFEATSIKTQGQLAEALEIHRSAISQAKRKNSVPGNWIFRLANMFNIDPGWLENGESIHHIEKTPDFRKIPKVKARLCAGAGSFETDAGNDEYFTFPVQWLNHKGNPDLMVLMNIFGNSMEPELKDGDTILVDQSQKDILAGAVYAVGIDDTIMVKRIEKRPGQLVLMSDNPHYAPIYLEGREMNSVRIIGHVIWVSRDLH